jgi:hypothetical protein
MTGSDNVDMSPRIPVVVAMSSATPETATIASAQRFKRPSSHGTAPFECPIETDPFSND